jgi:N4-(beta-N-acetylglucosaminyl)-L-asparaginase
MDVSRRRILGAGGSVLLAADTRPATATPAASPIIISANNGFAYLNRGYAMLAAGGDTLDAAIAVVTGAEDDPNDDSVGLGGLPTPATSCSWAKAPSVLPSPKVFHAKTC